MRVFFLGFVAFSMRSVAQTTATNAAFPNFGDTFYFLAEANPPALALGMTGAGNPIFDQNSAFQASQKRIKQG